MMRANAIELLSLTLLLLSTMTTIGGCAPAAVGEPLDQSLDGAWRITAEFLDTCAQIADGTITQIDENCDEQFIVPRSSERGVVVGDLVSWVVFALDTRGRFIRLDFRLRRQDDATLVGFEVIDDFSGRSPLVRQILMTRR